MAYVLLDGSDRVFCVVWDEKYRSQGMVEVDLPGDFDADHPGDYVMVDGSLVKDGAQSKREADFQASSKRSETRASQLIEFAAATVSAKTDMPRSEAVSVCFLINEWSPDGVHLEAGQWVLYDGDLYHVETAHDTQPDWAPDTAPSLFTRIKMAPDGIRIWEMPTHAENSFDENEKCHYPDGDGDIYISLIPGNTTVPGSDDRYWKKQ